MAESSPCIASSYTCLLYRQALSHCKDQQTHKPCRDITFLVVSTLPPSAGHPTATWDLVAAFFSSHLSSSATLLHRPLSWHGCVRASSTETQGLMQKVVDHVLGRSHGLRLARLRWRRCWSYARIHDIPPDPHPHPRPHRSHCKLLQARGGRAGSRPLLQGR